MAHQGSYGIDGSSGLPAVEIRPADAAKFNLYNPLSRTGRGQGTFLYSNFLSAGQNDAFFGVWHAYLLVLFPWTHENFSAFFADLYLESFSGL